MGKDLEKGFTKPCREYPRCVHKKHGYSRKVRHAAEKAAGKVKR